MAVHPGRGSPAKNWQLESFSEAARRLSRGAPWLLALGAAEEGPSPPEGATVVRSLRPRVLGALVARAGLFRGNDSGASHLAAACGAPTLALFGPTDPAPWAPVGRAVVTLRSTTGSMSGLALGPVEDAARVLQGAR